MNKSPAAYIVINIALEIFLKKRWLELGMALLLLSGVYFLAGRGAQMVNAQKGTEKVVVLDAGHGGDDPGKVGVNQVNEKDLNLVIAGKVKKELEEKGFTVIMTREDDRGLYEEQSQNHKVQDLQNRVELIHKAAPACAVSIHQNSYSEESVKGAQVFYYGDSVEGKKLAEGLQKALVTEVDPENHRQAKGNTSYYLLKKTDVPLAIVECGFLSNWKEAELLNNNDYQDKLAKAICHGIEGYLEGEK